MLEIEVTRTVDMTWLEYRRFSEMLHDDEKEYSGPYSSREVEQVLAGARRLSEKLRDVSRIDPELWRRPFTI